MSEDTQKKWALLKRLFFGWCMATVGGAVVTFGAEYAFYGTASVAGHLVKWAIVSGGALTFIVGVGMVASACADISNH